MRNADRATVAPETAAGSETGSSTESLAALRCSLNQFSPLPDPDWTPIAQWIVRRQIARGQHLLRAGQRASHAFFVGSGVLREYYVNREGVEATRRFCQAGELSGSLADLLSEGPALCSIEALEPGEVLSVEWARCDALSRTSPAWMMLLRRIAEGLYLRKIEREFDMLTLPAAARYRRFAESFPSLDARLPRTLVASYLGITPVHRS